MITISKSAAAASKSGAPLLSPKPLCGRALGVTVGVAELGVADAPVLVAACVCASAAWVSKAATVCVAGSDVDVGVSVNNGAAEVSVAVGGADVAVRVAVRVGVRVGVRVTVGVFVICKLRATAVLVSCAEDGGCGSAARNPGRMTNA